MMPSPSDVFISFRRYRTGVLRRLCSAELTAHGCIIICGPFRLFSTSVILYITSLTYEFYTRNKLSYLLLLNLFPLLLQTC